METIYESKFRKVTYDKALSLLINLWSDEEITEDEFQKELLSSAEQTEKYKPKHLVADMHKFAFGVTVEMQEWTAEKIFPRYLASGLEKFAIIESKELVAQISIEQAMIEETTGQLQTRYFATIDEALVWIK